MKTQFKGVFPVLVTPMDSQQNIDWGGLANNIEYYIDKKVGGLIPLGSTGEYVSLSKEERFALAEKTIEQVNGRLPVIVGATGESTKETIEYVQQAKSAGADGVMLANSYYCKPSEDEIFEHFRQINDAVDIPIMLYNIQMYTGVDMSEELLVRMGNELANVTYIKESSGSLQRLRDVKRKTIGQVEMFCGWDDLAIESFFVGATGWVSVVGNVLPEQANQLFHLAVEEKDYEAAWKVYETMLPLIQLTYYHGKLVQVTKRAMDFVGLAGGSVRSPRQPLTPDLEEKLVSMMESIYVG